MGVKPGTCSPNPDYWGALLFHRLLNPGNGGQAVMNVTAVGAPNGSLRAYGHCDCSSCSASSSNSTGAAFGDIALMLLNLANETSTVDLAGFAAVGSTVVQRTDFVLTPILTHGLAPVSILKTASVALNG